MEGFIMREFFFSTRFFKQLPSSESDINQQLNTFREIIEKISVIDPIFSTWYINNPTGTKPPLDYPFPTDKAFEFLLNLRLKDSFQGFTLWNEQDNSNFVSISFDTFDISMTFEKVFNCEQLIQLFRIMLEYLKFQYMYLNSDFFADINIFPHRLETTPICYVPKKIEDGDIPHLYKKIDINNELNQGTILIFDQNLFVESDEMKKKVQENSVALVDMGLIPEAELDADFFSGV